MSLHDPIARQISIVVDIRSLTNVQILAVEKLNKNNVLAVWMVGEERYVAMNCHHNNLLVWRDKQWKDPTA